MKHYLIDLLNELEITICWIKSNKLKTYSKIIQSYLYLDVCVFSGINYYLLWR